MLSLLPPFSLSQNIPKPFILSGGQTNNSWCALIKYKWRGRIIFTLKVSSIPWFWISINYFPASHCELNCLKHEGFPLLDGPFPQKGCKTRLSFQHVTCSQSLQCWPGPVSSTLPFPGTFYNQVITRVKDGSWRIVSEWPLKCLCKGNY